MNKKDLIANLEDLVKRYIDNEDNVREIMKNIEPSTVKYILGELDRQKSKEYSSEDINLIKDIYFYYG